ncbi:hypothetical protein NEUTE2DRAFT_60373 [Neurospora tetrasperma FGSC 2509]|nr:hypothetical protein NEUTE2DRAFT_60373 [Neurospora tetrasperma FGSC 2509]
MQDNKYTEVLLASVQVFMIAWASTLVLFCVVPQLLNTPLKWQEQTTLFGFAVTICDSQPAPIDPFSPPQLW